MSETLNFKQDPVHDFFDIGDEIGSGQFAVVKKCTEKSSGTEFAAKFLKKRRSKTARRGVSLEQIHREAGVLRTVNHFGIIYLHDIYETKLEYVLILELLSGGELFEFLSEQDYLTEEEAVGFTKQVIQAIAYLHGHSIAHLDIKPENIVLKDRIHPLKLKLIDFGLAREIAKGQTVREMMGTPEFVAPEVIGFEPVGLPTDMWSIGVLTYIMLSGASPFLGDDNNETFSNISHVDYEFDDEYFNDISQLAKDFIEKLLVKDPSERMTAEQCLEHEWLEEEVCLITSRPGAPPSAVKKRRSTMIRTEAFKAFTARARWKKSLNKVIAVSRIAMLGRKNEPIAKELMLQNNESNNDAKPTPELAPSCPAVDEQLPSHQEKEKNTLPVDAVQSTKPHEAASKEALNDNKKSGMTIKRSQSLRKLKKKTNSDLELITEDIENDDKGEARRRVSVIKENGETKRKLSLTKSSPLPNGVWGRMEQDIELGLVRDTSTVQRNEDESTEAVEVGRLNNDVLYAKNVLLLDLNSIGLAVKNDISDYDRDVRKPTDTKPYSANEADVVGEDKSHIKGTSAPVNILKEEGIKPMKLFSERKKNGKTETSFLTLSNEKQADTYEPSYDMLSSISKTKTKNEDDERTRNSKTSATEKDANQDKTGLSAARRRKVSDPLKDTAVSAEDKQAQLPVVYLRPKKEGAQDDDAKKDRRFSVEDDEDVFDRRVTLPRRKENTRKSSQMQREDSMEQEDNVSSNQSELQMFNNPDEDVRKVAKVKDDDVWIKQLDTSRASYGDRIKRIGSAGSTSIKAEALKWETRGCEEKGSQPSVVTATRSKADKHKWERRDLEDSKSNKHSLQTDHQPLTSLAAVSSETDDLTKHSMTSSAVQSSVTGTSKALLTHGNSRQHSSYQFEKGNTKYKNIDEDFIRSRKPNTQARAVEGRSPSLKMDDDRRILTSLSLQNEKDKTNPVPRAGEDVPGIGLRIRKNSNSDVMLDFIGFQALLNNNTRDNHSSSIEQESIQPKRQISLRSESVDLTEQKREQRRIDLTRRENIMQGDEEGIWVRRDAARQQKRELLSKVLSPKVIAAEYHSKSSPQAVPDLTVMSGRGMTFSRFRKNQRSKSEDLEGKIESADDDFVFGASRQRNIPVTQTKVNLDISKGQIKVVNPAGDNHGISDVTKHRDGAGDRVQAGDSERGSNRASRAEAVCSGRRSRSAERLRGFRLDGHKPDENKKKSAPDIDSRLRKRLMNTFANARNKFS